MFIYPNFINNILKLEYSVTRKYGWVPEISVFFVRFLQVRFRVKPKTFRKRSAVAVLNRKLPWIPQIRPNSKQKTRNFEYPTRLSGNRTPLIHTYKHAHTHIFFLKTGFLASWGFKSYLETF